MGPINLLLDDNTNRFIHPFQVTGKWKQYTFRLSKFQFTPSEDNKVKRPLSPERIIQFGIDWPQNNQLLELWIESLRVEGALR